MNSRSSPDAAAGPPPTPPRERKRQKFAAARSDDFPVKKRKARSSVGSNASNPLEIDDDDSDVEIITPEKASKDSIVDLTLNEVVTIDSDDDDEPLIVGTRTPEKKSPLVRSNTAIESGMSPRKKPPARKAPLKTSPKKPPPTRDTFVAASASGGAVPPPTKPPPKKLSLKHSPPTKQAPTFENVARRPSQTSPLSDYERGFIPRKKQLTNQRTVSTLDDDRKPAAKPRNASPANQSPVASRIQGRSIALEKPVVKKMTMKLGSTSSDEKLLTLSKANTNSHDSNSQDAKKQAYNDTVDLLSSDSEDEGDIEDDSSVQEELAKFQPAQNVGPYTYEEFLKRWEEGESIFYGEYGLTYEQIENGAMFRQANRKVSKENSDGQGSAQYGRMMPKMTQELVERIVNLKEGMIFADIGSGLGNICIQLAMTTSCEARGIELVDDRHFASLQVLDVMLGLNNRIIQCENKKHAFGSVKLERGSFEDPNHRDFLIEADCIICNNFNDVFGEKSRPKGQKHGYVLNNYLEGLLCLLKPGSVVVTLDKLHVVGQEDANKRRIQRGLPPSETASFVETGEFFYDDKAENRDLLSWRNCNKSFTVYKYTRNQSKVATFLCDDAKCDYARNSTPIIAWRELENGKVVLNSCPGCDGKPSAERSRKAPDRLVAKG